MFNYVNPIAQKNINGTDVRIAVDLIRNKEKSYLVYGDGKIVGQFYSISDAKTVIDYIAKNLVAGIESGPKFTLATSQITNVQTLKANKNYRAAKSGSISAAKDLLENIYEARKNNALMRHKDAELVPVYALEKEGVNKIPNAYAEKISKEYGNSANDEIYIKSKTQQTGSGALSRLLDPPIFAGKVTPGKKYYIVDDVSTTGSTLNELRNYI